MERSSMNNQQLENVLNAVSGKLGVSPDELQKALQSGSLDAAIKNMGKKEQQRLSSIMQNREQMEKLMNSPQAKALYEKLMGKKPQ